MKWFESKNGENWIWFDNKFSSHLFRLMILILGVANFAIEFIIMGGLFLLFMKSFEIPIKEK